MSAKPLNFGSGMPQVSGVLAGWMKSITLQKRQQLTNDGLVSYVNTDITFSGTIQPLSPRQIALKPEGQRAWEWLQIHAVAGTKNIADNDQIVYNGIIFKVMATKDYSLNGYIEYHLAREYQP